MEIPKRKHCNSISIGSEFKFVDVFTTALKISSFAPPGKIPSFSHTSYLFGSAICFMSVIFSSYGFLISARTASAIISAVFAQLLWQSDPQFPQQLICKIFASFATESLYFGFLPSACNSCAISFNLLAVFSTTCV